MELRHLRYLVAVAEEGSILRAAHRLRVAQSSLSRQIQDLEREVGVKLFYRVPRGVRLTPGGEEFLREARNTLDNAEHAVLSARQVQGHADQVLRFGHGSLGGRAGMILQLLADFRRGYPASEVEIHHLDEVGQRAALVEHDIDLAATWLSEPNDPSFDCLSLLDCSCPGALIPADHRLASQEIIRLTDLADLTLLHPSGDSWPGLYRATLAALAARGLVVTRGRSLSEDAHTATLEIATGGVWTLANETYAAAFCSITPAIVYRPFIEAPIPYHLALIWNPDSPSRWVQPIVEIARRQSQTSQVA